MTGPNGFTDDPAPGDSAMLEASLVTALRAVEQSRPAAFREPGIYVLSSRLADAVHRMLPVVGGESE